MYNITNTQGEVLGHALIHQDGSVTVNWIGGNTKVFTPLELLEQLMKTAIGCFVTAQEDKVE